MKKRNCLCLYLLVLSAFLLVLIFSFSDFLHTAESAVSGNGNICFSVEIMCGKENVTVNPWMDDSSGIMYVFLPSFADDNMACITEVRTASLSIDHKQISDGFLLSCLEMNTLLDFASDDVGETKICFLRSANVGTMFIDTDSGSMSKVHANKEYNESAEIKVFTADGTEIIIDREGKIKGRGNSTWRADKKTYLITLSSDESLFDMNSSDKWVLLANAYDETNIRNKMVYDFCKSAGGLPSPESQYVDLYLNGEYSGLYLLTEKNTSAENSGISDLTFLCHIFSSSVAQKNCFTTREDQYVQIDYPDGVSNSELKKVQTVVQNFENALFSKNEEDLISAADIDSWARKYLIDEVFENSDAGSNSFYFYSVKNDDKVYAGPLWDYDQILGSNRHNSDPECILAKKEWVNRIWYTPYYGMFCKNEEFCTAVSELFINEFLPLLNNLCAGGIDAYTETISEATAMNSIRWRGMFDSLQASYGAEINTPEALSGFLAQRTEFLKDALTNKEKYCTVLLETEKGSDYICVTAETGTMLKVLFEDSNIMYDIGAFTDILSGETCRGDMEIYDGMVLNQHCSVLDYIRIYFEDFSYIICIGIFILLLLVFLLVEFSKRGQVKRVKPQIGQN